MSKQMLVVVGIILFILIDIYVFFGSRGMFHGASYKLFSIAFWTVSALSLAAFLSYHLLPKGMLSDSQRSLLIAIIFIPYLSKFLFIIFLFLDDVIRLIRWLWVKGSELLTSKPSGGVKISRSTFLLRLAAILASIPLLSLTWGVIVGAHDYRIRKIKLPLGSLPKSWKNLKIVQISDIHSGSFWSRKGVERGIQMILDLEADIILFTGDLVNNKASEVASWIPVFGRLKAKYGVYSITGNHDYGDYVQWSSVEAKKQNFQQLVESHKKMGWDILMNENRILNIDGKKLALIGIENWSAKGRFPKYGNLSKAHLGTSEADYKILLSHDPSHWRAEVLPKYADIDLMLAGHTHGMQYGVEVGNVKWSPVQYYYPEWAGIYSEKHQQLYVNRGFGYIGYPGRFGIHPEITLFQFDE